MQNRIVERSKLLGTDGNLLQKGYATGYMLEYDRNDIRAKKARIKEWDYYYVGNDDHAICITVADMGYVGAISATFMDFKTPAQITKSSIMLFPMGKLHMPATPFKGDVVAVNGEVEACIILEGGVRHVFGKYPGFGPAGEELDFDFTLSDAPEECMFIATPFAKPKHFYYNAKINCMTAKGYFSLGDKKYSLDDALGTLDWGRGVWTYDNTWYWGSLQTVLPDGVKFGFNIGYGFGDTTAASENMLFYDGKAHKLEEVTFLIPGDGTDKVDYTAPWKFTSSDGRLELDFVPIIDRYEPFDLKLFCMIPHQVFGRFSGKCVLDDGKVIELNSVLGFAEKVHNKW